MSIYKRAVCPQASIIRLGWICTACKYAEAETTKPETCPKCGGKIDDSVNVDESENVKVALAETVPAVASKSDCV